MILDSIRSFNLLAPEKTDRPMLIKSKVKATDEAWQRDKLVTVICPVLERSTPSVSKAT